MSGVEADARSPITRNGTCDFQLTFTVLRSFGHPNTVFCYLGKPELTPLLLALVAESAWPLSAIETNFAVDATGFGTSTYGRWFDHKWGKQKKGRALWLKAHAMVGVKTNIVTAINVTKGNEGDAPYLPILLDETVARFKPEELSADKAYLTFNNLAAIDAAGATPYITFKSNSKDNPASAAWSRMFHMFHAHRDDFLPHYHRRSTSRRPSPW